MGLKRALLLAAAALFFAAALLPEAAAERYSVGDKMGWSQGTVNYTLWAQKYTFYNGDWLLFWYNRYQADVLEVNKTDYESCNSDHPLNNWTRGAGRDVVPLNMTKAFYFLSSKGMCYGGVKVAINVLDPPPPPSASPKKSSSPRSFPVTFRSRVVVPALFAVAAVWDSLLLLL